MLALEPLDCTRVVGHVDPTEDGGVLVRFAPDDYVRVRGVGTPHSLQPVAPSRRSAHHEVGQVIAEQEDGFSGVVLTPHEFWTNVAHAIHWELSSDRPAQAQGLVAGVPCKLFFGLDDQVLLFCATAYAHELMERLG